MHKNKRMLLGAVFAALLVLLAALSACAPTSRTTAPATAPTPAAISPSPTPAASTSPAVVQQGGADFEELLLVRLYEEVNPSVVNIRVVTNVPSAFAGLPDSQQQGQGSGFVWDTQGHIVTNNHVVENATRIEVTFSDGATLSATVVGTDPDSDLAVIKVDPTAHEMKPVKAGDSDAVKVGQRAIAIGNPFGLQGTLTAGIVSALGRDLPAGSQNATTGSSYRIPDVIQTDASINPGNSGGPLLDSKGEVIGVNSAIESPVSASAGIGFAIPVSIVKQVVPSLIQTGTYRHPWLGVSVVALSPDLAKAMGLAASQRGILVMEVASGGPAEKAGVKPSGTTVEVDGAQVPVGGDVIVQIDSQEVRRSENLISYLAQNTTVGQQVTLKVLRDGKTLEIQATLGERPNTRDKNT